MNLIITKMSIPNMPTGKIAGIVLVGGHSSRMGVNKALLDYQGKSLVEHMTELLHSTGLEDVYISGELDGHDNCILDDDAFAGPMMAIKTVIKKLQDYNALLLVPVDMPLLTSELLRRLMAHEKGAYYEAWPLPLYFPVITSFPDTGEKRSVQSLLEALSIPALPVPQELEEYFVNTNTPEEWKQVQK